MKSILFLAAFYLWSVFPAVAQMANLQIAKPGDSFILEIRTQPGDAPLSEAAYVISELGTLNLPLLKQEIPAAGIQFETLIVRINEAFAASGIQPVPSVKKISFPPQICSHIVTVGGNIQTPSEVGLRQGMTLMMAIDKAGGFSKTADPSRVKLIRADKETIYDLRKLNPDGSNNPVLMDGDEVVVTESSAKARLAALLKPGDSLQLAISGLSDSDSISTWYTVSDKGLIRLPQLEKEIPAKNITTAVLMRRINEAYKKAGMTNVMALELPLGFGGSPVHVVSVAGEVQASGEFPLRQGMTLKKAIDRAGGFTKGAVPSRVKLVRANKETWYNLSKIEPDGSNNPILMDGDLIVVPGN